MGDAIKNFIIFTVWFILLTGVVIGFFAKGCYDRVDRATAQTVSELNNIADAARQQTAREDEEARRRAATQAQHADTTTAGHADGAVRHSRSSRPRHH